jgi:hypothetical protein
VDIYVPQAQNVWSSAALVVRPSRGSAEALAPAVRAAVARVDNAVPVTQVRTLDDVGAASHGAAPFSCGDGPS